jgi:two-component system nitrate/nitrite response regulator NarL
MASTPRDAEVLPAPAAHVITVALIEDNRMVREGITALLNRFPDLQVVSSHPSGNESLLASVRPHVILLDVGLENGDSLRVATEVVESHPDTRVILMDLFPAHEELIEFISAGVSGFIMKDATVEEVVGSIRRVAAGGQVLPPQMTSTLFSEIARDAVLNGGESPSGDSVRLTPREREVIDLISEGLSNKAIAKRLDVSPHTVKSHLRNIMEKLMLHTRLQIAAYAHGQETGVLSDP